MDQYYLFTLPGDELGVVRDVHRCLPLRRADTAHERGGRAVRP